MAWIESHQALGRHPKTIHLAELLKVRVPEAVGLLQFLWWWALDYAPNGLVISGDKPVVARACLWHRKPDDFWGALLTAGFVEQAGSDALKIHDWMDYAGRLIERRAANAERMKAKRAAHVQRTLETRAPATVPDRTQPDTTVPDHPPSIPPTTENGRAANTCCPLAAVTNGKDHMQSCPTMAASAC